VAKCVGVACADGSSYRAEKGGRFNAPHQASGRNGGSDLCGRRFSRGCRYLCSAPNMPCSLFTTPTWSRRKIGLLAADDLGHVRPIFMSSPERICAWFDNARGIEWTIPRRSKVSPPPYVPDTQPARPVSTHEARRYAAITRCKKVLNTGQPLRKKLLKDF